MSEEPIHSTTFTLFHKKRNRWGGVCGSSVLSAQLCHEPNCSKNKALNRSIKVHAVGTLASGDEYDRKLDNLEGAYSTCGMMVW